MTPNETVETPIGPSGPPRIVLSLEKQIKLVDWVRQKRDQLAKENVSPEKAAELASADLGFPVTVANVRTTTKATGTEWRTVTPRKKKAKVDSETVTQLKHDIADLLKIIREIPPSVQLTPGEAAIVAQIEARLGA